MPDTLWQQYRRVAVTNTSLTADGTRDDFDLDITVRDAAEEGVSFEVRALNLAPDTWSSISKGDPIAITLGWVDGPQSAVCTGLIKQMWPEQKNNDVEYLMKGIDASRARTQLRVTRSYEGQSPSAIARNLAAEMSLSPGIVDATDPIDGMYCVTTDQPIRYWLDMLVAEAQNQTGDQWEWQARAGQLHFRQKATPTQEAVVLSHEHSLLELNPASGRSTADSEDELEFKALCEPSLRKGGLVQVQTAEESGVYQVTDLEFQSNSRDGSHFATGSLAPQTTQWTMGYPRAKYQQILDYFNEKIEPTVDTS